MGASALPAATEGATPPVAVPPAGAVVEPPDVPLVLVEPAGPPVPAPVVPLPSRSAPDWVVGAVPEDDVPVLRPDEPAGCWASSLAGTVVPQAAVAMAASPSAETSRHCRERVSSARMACLEVAQEGRLEPGDVRVVQQRGRDVLGPSLGVQLLHDREGVARDSAVERDGADHLGL